MRPILFSDAMVRAILDGTKTQTRRVMKKQPPPGDVVMGCHYSRSGWSFGIEGGGCRCTGTVTCPYGAEGDRLWVREAITRDLYADTSHFRADNAPTKADAWPWKRRVLPGMFMPIGLRRIDLELTDVRAQYLNDISEADARAEGCDAGKNMREGSCRDLFSVLWDSINAERAPWASNPWVWALTFKKVTP